MQHEGKVASIKIDPNVSRNFQVAKVLSIETFEKCSILFKFKPPAHRGLRPGGESENFKCRNTLSISRLFDRINRIDKILF
jgi:hypothetical protein